MQLYLAASLQCNYTWLPPLENPVWFPQQVLQLNAVATLMVRAMDDTDMIRGNEATLALI